MTTWTDHAYRPRRTWPQRFLLTVGVLSTFTAILAAVGTAWGLQRYNDIQFLEVPNVEPAQAGKPANWLLVGSDSREGIDPNDPNAGAFLAEAVEGKRTDTIIVARIDPEGQTIDLLSVPRDLWVPIAGTGENGRVNAAFNGEGGEQRLVSTVEDSLGIEINHYAEINFVGFQAIIDAVGGVPIWFETPVRDPKSGLDVPTAGCHALGGFEALAFARSRSLEYQAADGEWRADPTGDLGRTARQQFLLSRLAATTSSKLDLTDIATVDRILRVGGQNLVIDDGAGAGDLFGLARTFSAVGGEGIRRHALPVEGFRTSGGASVLDLLEAEAQPTLDIFRGVAPPTVELPTDEVVARNSFSVEVQNGARIAGIAATTADELEAAGFLVSEATNSPDTVAVTEVHYPSSMAAAASVLGSSLAEAPRYIVDDSLELVVLIVGPDYAGLADPAAAAIPATDEQAAEAAPAPTPAPVDDNIVGVVPTLGPPGTPCA
ncbi:MAG: LCP family protein [Acidimicrobiales bacterium]